ncbi:MAG: cardiolipin synthase [Gammaproteobacteria bacterium]|nr:MAG: cardiolipin synthase [Gammaproteobacteria bacterium]
MQGPRAAYYTARRARKFSIRQGLASGMTVDWEIAAGIGPLESLWLLSWLGALLTVPSVLLQRAGRPLAALSWLLALFAIPAAAVLGWWLLGRTHLQRKRRRRRRAAARASASLAEVRSRLEDATGTIACLPASLPPDVVDRVFPPSGGNRVALLPDTAAAHAAWLDMIDRAQRHLHLLFYIWRDDHIGRRIRDRLIDKAAAGVEVRVLYDAIGSIRLPRRFFEPLREAGGQAVPFMPIRLLSPAPTINFRNHRKLLLADGRQACTGGINIGDEYLDWRDIGVRISGPGVNQLQEVFIDDWYFSSGEELADSAYFWMPDGPPAGGDAVCETIASGPDQAINVTRDMVFLAISRCRRRLWIATPYFVPDPALLVALRTAVYRGVDVRLLLPARSDVRVVRRASRVFYDELLTGGVRIYEYPGMSHAKVMLLDEDVTMLGSANLDIRSFRLNFELNSFITDRRLNGELERLFRQWLDVSAPVSLADLQRSGTLARLADSLAHLLSPLL